MWYRTVRTRCDFNFWKEYLHAPETLFAAELIYYIKVYVLNYQKYVFISETKGIPEKLLGENTLIGSDITSTVKSASSEQEQKCKY